MSIRRISVRFNLDKETDRKAWEKLDGLSSISKNKAIIDAIIGTDASIIETIKQTIADCLKNIAVSIPAEEENKTEITEDENTLLDSLNDFLGM